MSLAGLGPKSGSRYIWPRNKIIAWTELQGPVLYKGVNDAARPPEVGPAEAGGPFGLESRELFWGCYVKVILILVENLEENQLVLNILNFCINACKFWVVLYRTMQVCLLFI